MKQITCLLLFVAAVAFPTHVLAVAPPPPGPYDDCLEDLVYRKWNDVLYVTNEDSVYVAYQWYCDDVIMPGETNQFLFTDGNSMYRDGHWYSAAAMMADGTWVYQCAMLFEDIAKSYNNAPEPAQAPRLIATPMQFGSCELQVYELNNQRFLHLKVK